jgi:hypothetical protein
MTDQRHPTSGLEVCFGPPSNSTMSRARPAMGGGEEEVEPVWAEEPIEAALDVQDWTMTAAGEWKRS